MKWIMTPEDREMFNQALIWVLVGFAIVLIASLAFQVGKGGGPMFASVICMLFFAAFVCAILEALGKCPGFLPSLLLAIAGLLGCLPR